MFGADNSSRQLPAQLQHMPCDVRCLTSFTEHAICGLRKCCQPSILSVHPACCLIDCATVVYHLSLESNGQEAGLKGGAHCRNG